MAPFDNIDLARISAAEPEPTRAQKHEAFRRSFPLETSRLVIREITPRDVDAFHELVDHPEFSYYYFDGTREKTQAFVDDAIEARRAVLKGELRKSFMMAVENKETGALVGHVTVDLLDKAPDDYDLAYFVHPSHWGRGYGTEAVAGFLNALFNTVAPPQVVATAHPDNTASRKLLTHVGFNETGNTTQIESADGKGERLWYLLKPEDFRFHRQPAP